MEKAFIAQNKYMQNEIKPFGVGVVASFNEEVAKSDSHRFKCFEMENTWWEIEIPSKETFLNLNSILEVHNEYIFKSLFSQKSITTLFKSDLQDFYKNDLDSLIQQKLNSENSNDKTELAKFEVAKFYQQKENELKQCVSVEALLQFITSKAKDNDLAITSSFLFNNGINGVIYNEGKNERILIFDAQKSIKLKELHKEKLSGSKFI